MPKISSPRQYGFIQAKAHGTARKAGGPTAEQAREMIHETPPEKRSRFQQILARGRKRKGRR